MAKWCDIGKSVTNFFLVSYVVEISRECVDKEGEQKGGEHTALGHPGVEGDFGTAYFCLWETDSGVFVE